MATRIVADLEILRQAEVNFERELKAFNDILDDLDRQLRGHLAEWDGDSAAAYRAMHGRWNESARAMGRGIAWLKRVVQTTHGNFHASLTTNLRMWES
jgi:early secretory antigenic target protein ESAT-6